MKKFSSRLAVILLLAGILRWINLDGRGLEYDDAFSILLAGQPLAEIVSGTAADTMPPLYYFLLHGWLEVSSADWFLRTLNVAFSLGIVLLIYKLVVAVRGEPAGLLAAFFTAISPLQIFHAQGMRMYVLLTLSGLVYAWCFLKVMQAAGKLGPRAKPDVTQELDSRPGAIIWWIGLVLAGAAAMYSHNLAIFTLVVPDLLLLLRRDWETLRRLLAAQFIIGVLALPWLVFIPGQVSKIQAAFWTPRPGLQEILQALITFHTNLPVPSWFLAPALLISAEVAVFVFIESLRRRRADPALGILVGFAVIPPLLLFTASYLMRPVFVPRPMMLSGVVYLGLLALAIVNTRVRLVGVLVGVSFFAGALVALPYQYQFDAFPRSPFEDAVVYLENTMEPGDTIIHDNKLSFFPSYYYAPELPQTFLADEAGSHNETLAFPTQLALKLYPEPDIAAAADGARRIWFVMFVRAQDEYQLQGRDHPVLTWLESSFDLENEMMFNDLQVLLYTR